MRNSYPVSVLTREVAHTFRRVTLLAILCLVTVVSAAENPQGGHTYKWRMPEGKTHILWIGGGHWHDTLETTVILRRVLERTGRYHVTYSEDTSVLTRLDRYDVVVLNGMFDSLESNEEKSLLSTVQGGKPLLVLHAASASFRKPPPAKGVIPPADHPEFYKMLGGYVQRHPPFGSVSVHVMETEHTITKGLTDFIIEDELFLFGNLEPDNHVLLEADYKGERRPLAWTRHWGEGRVFHLALGHNGKAAMHASFQRLMVQGLDWLSVSKAEFTARRLGRGIVVDVSPRQGGNPLKVLHEPAQYDTLKAAGFQSIRIYVVAMMDPVVYKTRIDDALDRGLAVVISMWGNGQWALKPKEGLQEFVEAWDKYARYYRDYPDGLVFDLWNEPGGLMVKDGKPIGIEDGGTAMEYLNAVIPVVRKTNPTRTLGVGGPGLNECHQLEQYVTPEYLPYRLEDGTGFEDDGNIIGLVHMYHPMKFTHWILGLDRAQGWQDEVREALAHTVAWSTRWRKPVLIGEWGAWAPPCHSVEDFKTYIGFVVDECRKNNIGWMYYCAGFNNQWPFNILHTEDGWNQDALDILTGVESPRPAPMSPLINTEFGWSTSNWSSEGSARISVTKNAGLSGPTALKVEATKSERAEVYQQTPKRKGSPPGRYLISVRKGRLYKICFLARSVNGTGTLKVRLADVSGSSGGFWTSKPVEISDEKKEYTIEYKHTGSDINDVRLAMLFGDQDQTILLDRISLRGYRQ